MIAKFRNDPTKRALVPRHLSQMEEPLLTLSHRNSLSIHFLETVNGWLPC